LQARLKLITGKGQNLSWIKAGSFIEELKWAETMTTKLKILHLEDNPSDAALIGRALKKGNIEFDRLIVDSKEEFTKALAQFHPDIILSDHSLPAFNSHEALAIFQDTGMKIPFILITANVSEEFAVDVIKRGADDYILKDRLERLPAAIKNALEKCDLEKKHQHYLDELIKNETHFRTLTENIQDAITLLNKNEEWTYQSPSVERLTGFAFEDLNGKKIMQYVHPDDQIALSRFFGRLKDVHGVPIQIQFRLLHKKTYYIRIEGTIINLLHNESVNAFILNFRDITQRLKTEAELLNVYEEKNVILESIADGFYALDKNWIITYWNKEAERLLNLKRENVIGKNLWELYPAEKHTITYINYQKAVSDSSVAHFERFNEEISAWLEISAYPSANGLSVYFKDITQRKKTEEERNQMMADIVRRNKDLEQFAYIVSHNLRAPTANIIGLIDELSGEKHNDDEMLVLGKYLGSAVKQLDDVIRDLNTILEVKHELGEKKVRVIFSELIEDIKASIQNLINRDNVIINVDFSEIDEVVTVKSYLYSVFYNLISNSMKYCQANLPALVEIKSKVKNGKLLIIFKDNGCGIDMDKNSEHVFGLYKRFHQNIEGKGMGLFMVKTQVESLGGKITVSSEVNKGTRFTIEL
jgi:PAS domain S-box-containing protein